MKMKIHLVKISAVYSYRLIIINLIYLPTLEK